MQVKALIALGLLALSAWLGWEWRDRSADLAIATLEAKANKAEALAQANARKVEQERQAGTNAAAERYEQGKKDAQAEADRIVAGLANGSLRLRKHWAACETGRLSDRAATAGELEAERKLRAEAVGRIIGIGREADAHVQALIQAYEAQSE
jgi:hypothetical protein